MSEDDLAARQKARRARDNGRGPRHQGDLAHLGGTRARDDQAHLRQSLSQRVLGRRRAAGHGDRPQPGGPRGGQVLPHGRGEGRHARARQVRSDGRQREYPDLGRSSEPGHLAGDLDERAPRPRRQPHHRRHPARTGEGMNLLLFVFVAIYN